MRRMNVPRTKRIYDQAAPDDGFRVLVDRLWPRGVSKDKAQVDLWLKDIAPSTELRHWFHSGAGDFAEFSERYLAELDANPAVARLERLLTEQPVVTLLYSVRDEESNHARILQRYLSTDIVGSD